MAQAKGRKPPGEMNRVEEEYSRYLQERKDAGQISDFAFEAVTLKLADNTRYTPDFMVLDAFWQVEFHDVKGREGTGPGGWREDARVKIKVATTLFPWFRFIGVSALPKKKGGGFSLELFSRDDA